MKIDVLGLQAFLAIAEHGSFQRAAGSLNLTSTALSHRLRKLEADVGVRLFSRTTRRVTLTPMGSGFFAEARRLFDALSASYEGLRASGKQPQQELGFGCLPTLAHNVMPDIVKRFCADHPMIRIRIADRIAPELTELVQKGAIEFALTIGTEIGPPLDFKTLVNIPMVVFCPSDHPLSGYQFLSPKDLEGVRLIHLGPRDGTRVQIEEAFGSRDNALRWDCEVHQSITAIRLVAAGVGLTVAPQFAADLRRVPEIVQIPLRNPRLTNSLGILTRRETLLSPAAEAMIKIIRKYVRARLLQRSRANASPSDD